MEVEGGLCRALAVINPLCPRVLCASKGRVFNSGDHPTRPNSCKYDVRKSLNVVIAVGADIVYLAWRNARDRRQVARRVVDIRAGAVVAGVDGVGLVVQSKVDAAANDAAEGE